MNKNLDTIANILLIVGGLNWGLVGVANWNVVEIILGSWPVVASIVYILVGLSALYAAWGMVKGRM